MTEDEFRRRPSTDRPDLRERLAVARKLLARTLDDLRSGALPVPTGERNVLDRDEALACAAAADGIAHLLRHPPGGGTEARVVAQQDRVLYEARARQRGDKP